MNYYLLILIGVVLGYAICAVMTAARDYPAQPRRCKDCAHSRPIPENVGSQMIYDFERAWDTDELKTILCIIAQYGWTLVSVTQDEGLHTVFFGRPCR